MKNNQPTTQILTLGEVLTFKYGKGLPAALRHPGQVPVYGSNGIVGTHCKPLVAGPAIIIGRKGSIGEVHLSNGACWPIDTTYYVDEFGEHCPNFWFSYLKHLDLRSLDRASAIPGLNREDAYRIKVIVPSSSEQRRIVAKLDSFLAKSRFVRDELDHIPKLVERYKEAVLAAAFQGRLSQNPDGRHADRTMPNTWRRSKLSALCEAIVDCPHTTPKWTSEGEICLRTSNFRPGKLDFSEVRYVTTGTYQERIARLAPRADDIVYSREGGILGIACQIPENVRVCLGQRMMLLRVDRRVFSPSLLMHFLNSPATKAKVRELTGGTASPHLNVGDVKNFEVPVPPRDEQDRIINAIANKMTAIEAAEQESGRAIALLNRFENRTCADAFAGALLPLGSVTD